MMFATFTPGKMPDAHAFRGGIPAALAAGSFYAFTPASI